MSTSRKFTEEICKLIEIEMCIFGGTIFISLKNKDFSTVLFLSVIIICSFILVIRLKKKNTKSNSNIKP